MYIQMGIGLLVLSVIAGLLAKGIIQTNEQRHIEAQRIEDREREIMDSNRENRKFTILGKKAFRLMKQTSLGNILINEPLEDDGFEEVVLAIDIFKNKPVRIVYLGDASTVRLNDGQLINLMLYTGDCWKSLNEVSEMSNAADIVRSSYRSYGDQRQQVGIFDGPTCT